MTWSPAACPGVVDPLKAIEVEYDQREGHAGLVAAMQQALAAVEQRPAVGDAGQRILSASGDVSLLLPFLGNEDHEDRRADRVEQALEIDDPEPAVEGRQGPGDHVAADAVGNSAEECQNL